METIKRSGILLIIGLALAIGSYGQEKGSIYGDDSATCRNNLSTMSEFVKIKVYEYAYEPWRYCFNHCPGASRNIYIQGESIVKYKIDEAKTPEEKEAFIDTLMLLYDLRIQYFNQEGKVLGKKGIDLLKYRRDAVEESYGYLKKSVELDKNTVDEAVAATFMTTSTVLFRTGKIQADEMISNYLMTNQYLESQNQTASVVMARESVERSFAESGAADCDALIKIFTPKYEANKQDLETLKKITELLKNAKCQKSDLFASASESLFAIEPSATAGANLGIVFADRKEFSKAIEYYTRAIELETDNVTKSKYYYQLAAIAMEQRNLTQVRDNCKLSIQFNPNYGEAYLLLGNAYALASSSCGSTNFEKASVYLAAVDQFNKAKSVDQSVTERANEMINNYSRYFPNTEDAFFEGYTDGQTYTIKCWVGETTTIRTRKN